MMMRKTMDSDCAATYARERSGLGQVATYLLQLFQRVVVDAHLFKVIS
jgi:hypothetical protein